MNKPLLKKLLRDLWVRKASLGALVFVGVLGVAFLTSTYGVYFDLRDARDAFYQDYHLADFRVTLKAAPDTLLSHLANQPGIDRVEGTVSLNARLELPGFPDPIQTTLVGVPETGKIFNQLLSTDGGLPKPLEYGQALASSTFVRAQHLKAGDHLDVILLGQQERFQLLGAVQSPEFVYVLAPGGSLAPDPQRTAVLFLPLRQLQDAGQLQNSYNQVLGRFTKDIRGNPTKEREILDRLEVQLAPYGVLEATPRSQFTSVQFLESDITGLKVSASVMPTLCMIIVTVVLNVVIGRLIAGQRTIVGTLKALGYANTAITSHYLGFGFVVGSLGAFGGIILGAQLHRGLLSIYRGIYELPIKEPGSYPFLIVIAIGLSIGSSLLGTAFGVRAAARLAPAVAMRPPPPERGGRILLEKGPLRQIFECLPFSWKLILRAIFRNPFRSAVTLGSSFIATTIMVESLSMGSSIGVLINNEFRVAKKQDVTVTLQEPHPVITTEREFQKLPGVEGAEGQLSVPASLWALNRDSANERQVLILGIPDNPQLENPLWLSPDISSQLTSRAHGIFLSRKLAQVLGVEKGDELTVQLRRGTRRRVTLAVMGLVDTSLGLGCYMARSQLSSLIGEVMVADKFLLKVPSSQRPPLVAALSARPDVLNVTWRSDSLHQMKTTLEHNVGIMLNVIIAFCGFLAFGAVLNTALVALAEREREVGTLRVLGYSPFSVTAIFSGESLLLNCLGIVTGWLGGLLLTYGVCRAYDTEIFRIPFVANPTIIFQASGVMLVFLLTSQLTLGLIVRQLPWLDVLKIRE